MKKILLLTVALMIALSMTACEFSFGIGGTQPPTTSQPPASGDTTAEPPASGDATEPLQATQEPPASGAAFTIDKTKYAPYEAIRISASGVTQAMVDAGAFIGVYRVGADHGEYMDYIYVKLGMSTGEIYAPEESGSYELRLFKEDFNYVPEALLHTVAFTVE